MVENKNEIAICLKNIEILRSLRKSIQINEKVHCGKYQIYFFIIEKESLTIYFVEHPFIIVLSKHDTTFYC